MPDMASPIDLSELRVQRAAERSRSPGQRRRLLTRYVLPLFVLAGFAAVLAWSARDSLVSSAPVTVVPVIATRAELKQAGTPLFQAAGWVEPRPTPITVTALAEGVLSELLVVPGQEVAVGQPLARLLDADARIAADDAEASLELKQAELAAAEAALTAARSQLEQPVAMQAALAEAESLHAKVKTELGNLPFSTRAAQSRLELAKRDLSGKRSAGQAVSERTVDRAQSEFESATAALEELMARAPGLEREAAALERRCEALRKQLELKTEEKRRVAEAEAGVKIARAKLRQAELLLQTAKLRLERMTVCSPITGRVLALNAQPGKRMMGLDHTSEYDAATVLTLYDPRMLQVRADVRLEDVRQVQPGQPVRIESAAVSEPLAGEVLTATSLADVQKNTLQVKVAVHSPPPMLKPEMLVQVTFLAPQKAGTESQGAQQALRLLAPRQLVESVDGETCVWVADGVRRAARRQTVKLGRAGTEELIEVVEGLTATDKLIAGGREGLEDGTRIRITGEETTLGGSNRGTVGNP
jgi:multidrug efflux pump subunit AcrA (membrane-fusion protein)